jgi:tetratricopeptide (TPR) repeat protein
MTLTLNLPDHLAAPREAQTAPPSEWGAAPPPHLSPAAGVGGTPSFLLHARTAADAHPESAIAWARLAQAAQAAGQHDEAIGSAQRALALGIAQGAAPAVHAAVIVLGTYDDCESLQTLLEDPRALELPAAIRVRAALEVGATEAAVDLLGDRDEPSALAVRAWLALERGDFQTTVSNLRRARRLGATGPALLINLGYAHAALGELDKAISVTRQAAAMAPFDRTAGFNLAGYHRAKGDIDSALAVFDRLQPGTRPDFDLALAKADVLVEAQRSDDALRLLHAVRTSQEWATADRVSRSELAANLAFLRWMMNREKQQPALKAILRALEDCDFESVEIAYMLPNLLRDAREAPILDEVLLALSARHPDEQLHGLQMHAALLRREGGSAMAHALAWVEGDPLNPCAAALAVHLLSDLGGRFEEAADLGALAVARNPASLWLVNNAAYAAALAGRTDEAARLIERVGSRATGDVMLTATRALATMLGGATQRGLDGYREAHQIAEEQDDRPLALLVDLNLVLAVNLLPEPARARAAASLSQITIPAGLTHRLDFWVVGQRLERELGVNPGSDDSHYWRMI